MSAAMHRKESDLRVLAAMLLTRPESEVIEFKSAQSNYDTDRLGRYAAGLANEANLRRSEAAWVIFGVEDNGSVCGTRFRQTPGQLERLKHEIAEHSLGHGLREIHEVSIEGKRVLLFEIAPAPAGIPVSWKGAYYARNGESLTQLSPSKHDEIRRQVGGDWSSEIVEGATVADLDEAALLAARETFRTRHPNLEESEVGLWSDEEFLERLGVSLGGKLTRAGILLLGKSSSSVLLGQTMPEMTWILKDGERVYEHFGLPFLSVADRVFNRVRNYQIRLLQPNSLTQTEVPKYDRQSILEALHNCVAHMDYRVGARVTITEHDDHLVIENPGEFYDGDPEEYVLQARQPLRYRNPLLVRAMTELNMIDHIGYGIATMTRSQVKRFLPLPDYDLQPQRVRLTIYGAEIDKKFSELLMERTDLPLHDVFALDRVQKGLGIHKDAARRLKQAKLIEGRAPDRLHISASVARATGTEAEYMRVREIDDRHYSQLIVDYIEKFGPVKRADLDAYLRDRLHQALSEAQKRNKVHTLLQKLRKEGRIETIGIKRGAKWRTTKDSQLEN